MEARERLEVLADQLDPADAALLRTAFDVAELAHRDQFRKHGAPFIGHPLTAATVLLDTFGVRGGEILAAALLHDVVEDTKATLADLSTQFPSRTVELVGLVTDPRPHMTSDERRRHYEKIWLDADATLLKSADRLANLADVILTDDPTFIRRYAARTRNEMLGPNSAASVHPVAGPLLRAAVERCERAVSTQPPVIPEVH